MGAAAPGRVLRVTARAARRRRHPRRGRRTRRCAGIEARLATPRGELAIEARPLIGQLQRREPRARGRDRRGARARRTRRSPRGIAALPGVPGRVERVAERRRARHLRRLRAHARRARATCSRALRPLTTRRLICVFGCGGDRDPTKRPKMGAAVAELADLAVVTSDNPRTEDPRAIIDQILPGGAASRSSSTSIAAPRSAPRSPRRRPATSS